MKWKWNVFTRVFKKNLFIFLYKSFTYYLFTLSSAFTRQNDIKQKIFKYYKSETTRQCYVTYNYFVKNIGFIDLWVDQYVVVEICVLSCLILFKRKKEVRIINRDYFKTYKGILIEVNKQKAVIRLKLLCKDIIRPCL